MNKKATFEKLLAGGCDNALLRYSLGSEYAHDRQYDDALCHLQKALEFNPEYSAAWKLYAHTLKQSGDEQAAIAAYAKGIKVAESNGDMQAVKEMVVFLKRLQ